MKILQILPILKTFQLPLNITLLFINLFLFLTSSRGIKKSLTDLHQIFLSYRNFEIQTHIFIVSNFFFLINYSNGIFSYTKCEVFMQSVYNKQGQFRSFIRTNLKNHLWIKSKWKKSTKKSLFSSNILTLYSYIYLAYSYKYNCIMLLSINYKALSI